MNKMFFSQRLLDTLADEGKIALEGNILTVTTHERLRFELEPGYKINRTADNGPDPNGLVGLIKTAKSLREMHAEVYLDSVICRDTAYQADPGFIGEEREILEKLADTDLLSRYLLDTLL